MGIVNILYGICLAISQTNIKKILSYLTLVQVGFILIGLSTFNKIGFEGALFHLITFNLTWCGLFMLLGSVYLRTKTMEKNILGGLNKVMPVCYNLGLILILCVLAIPFTGNFVSNFMILNGLILNELELNMLFNLSIGIYVLGLIMLAICIVFVFHKTFYGQTMARFKTSENELIYPKRGITKSEIIVLSLIVMSLLFLGIFPNSILEIFNSTSEVIIDFLKV